MGKPAMQVWLQIRAADETMGTRSALSGWGILPNRRPSPAGVQMKCSVFERTHLRNESVAGTHASL